MVYGPWSESDGRYNLTYTPTLFGKHVTFHAKGLSTSYPHQSNDYILVVQTFTFDLLMSSFIYTSMATLILKLLCDTQIKNYSQIKPDLHSK